MNLSYLQSNDTICAISTAQGMGAIAVLRLSGPNAINIANSLFKSPSEKELLIEISTQTASSDASMMTTP
jgi:tRNA modification GTPase